MGSTKRMKLSKKVPVRTNVVMDAINRSGAGVHGKSNKAKRKLEKQKGWEND